VRGDYSIFLAPIEAIEDLRLKFWGDPFTRVSQTQEDTTESQTIKSPVSVKLAGLFDN
jgi:hypothetical protein